MATSERQDRLSVIIMTPDKEIWSGQAQAVSSKNSDGPFDVLPGHANFITLIQDDPIRVVTEKGEQEFSFDQAILSVHKDTVRVYGNI